MSSMPDIDISLWLFSLDSASFFLLCFTELILVDLGFLVS